MEAEIYAEGSTPSINYREALFCYLEKVVKREPFTELELTNGSKVKIIGD